MKVLLAVAGAVTLAACASAPPPEVRLAGSPSNTAALVGRWEGEYAARETGRAGSIVFTLIAGEDHAHGDVVMIPEGLNRPLEPWFRGEFPHPVATQPLSIELVAVAGDRVTGTLTPYRDPETGQPMATTFEGRLTGNRIEGTFTTYVSGGRIVGTGTWRVQRR